MADRALPGFTTANSDCMDYTEFKELARIAKEKNPVWFALEADRPAADGEIAQAEAELGVTFPPEYRDFLRDFGGGYFAFVNVFSVQTGSQWNIVQRNKRHAIDAFIAISDNGVGDLYGFGVSDGVCRPHILFSDHETNGNLKPTNYQNVLEFLAEKGLRHKS